MTRSTYYSTYALWFAATLYSAKRINAQVDEPYMDEIFHVPQAQAYCRGEWSHWDGAITTPPGLYLVPAALAALKRQFPFALDVDPCSLSNLRLSNLVLVFALPFLYTSILDALQASRRPLSTSYVDKTDESSPRDSKRDPSAGNDWEGLAIAMMPTVAWFGWLYYTDLGSIVAVLVSFRLALGRSYGLSSFSGLISLLFRQTNIVWIAFVASFAAVTEVKRSRPGAEVVDPSLARARLADVVKTPISLVASALRRPSSLVSVLRAYLPVFAVAVAFIRWNGGIVLGDKTNHVATVHLPQLCYFVAFVTIFASPALVSPRSIRRAISGLGGTPLRLCGSAIALLGMCWTIKEFTIAHPFLLADNRHYAFYVWRRIVNVHPLARYALAVAYLVGARLIWQGLVEANTMSLSTLVVLTVATVAVLVPTPLIEPRYFLTPYLLVRLFLSPLPRTSATRRRTRLLIEAALGVLVQACSVYLFLERSFEWRFDVGPDGRGVDGRDARELGRKQRFMW
ncbi:hypothetical protein JCM10212_001579 [Sporobolomyces blumeae]